MTFAAYRYITHVLGVPAALTGVDVKAQARARNTALADALGYTQLRFVEGSIAAAPVPRADVVLALHACDTATDEAVARAVAWNARAILAAPCCHHHIQTQLRRQPSPTPFQPVMHDGILAERWADVLTDALRASLLRQRGYRTDVVEFIPSQHTPRNTLLRATRTDAPPEAAHADHYASLTELWRVKPHLATLLGL